LLKTQFDVLWKISKPLEENHELAKSFLDEVV
ncbi:MAG: hypothetical protein ACD_56C00165G0012, partial [uncultured bacterium]